MASSFHGTVFSIIFEKKFFSIPHTMTPQRVENLLKDLDLLERIPNDSTEPLKSIDYKKVKNLLKYKIKESEMFLSEAINNS